MKFLKLFIAAWRQAQLAYTYDVFSDTDGGWDADDAKRLSEFFASNTGIKLKARLTNYVIRCAMIATSQERNYRFHMGIARGTSLAVQVIEQHFATSGRKPVISEDQQQKADAAADFALN